jgi:germacradienol/geosmin synthase
MVESWLWELDNVALNKVPDPIDYLEMRRRTFGAELTACLASIKRGNVVPAELTQHEAIASLENSAADYACMINDVFSYQKEIQYEGDVHNMLLIVQTFFDCSYEDASRIVDDVMTQRLAQFQRAAEIELPLAYADYDLDEKARAALDGRAAQLRDWIAAVLNWHRHTHRYAEEDLARHFRSPVSALTPGHGPAYWK